MCLPSAPSSLCVQPRHFKHPDPRYIKAQMEKWDGGDTGREILKSAADWQKPPLAAEWDSLGQLRYKLTTSILPPLCFSPFLLLCLPAFEDCQSWYQKRTLLSYSLFCKCNLSLLCSHSLFFRFQKIPTHACTNTRAHMWIDARKQTNRIKQHQRVSKWKSVSFMDCVMLQIIFCFAWHSSDFLRQCRSDLKIRFWYLTWQLHSN